MRYPKVKKRLPVYYHVPFSGPRDRIYYAKSPLRSEEISSLHFHDCLEVGICLEGEGTNCIEDRAYPFRVGDMQVVASGVPHFCCAARGVKARWVWMSVDPVFLMESVGFDPKKGKKEWFAPSFSAVFHPWEYPEIAEILRKMMELEEKGEALELACVVGQLLGVLSRLTLKEGVVLPRGGGVLSPAIEEIRARFSDSKAMRQENLASLCHLSVSHFRAKFKEEMGMNMREFLLFTRLSHASELLMATEKSVLEIAFESGFGQISCFNRAFRKAYGLSPVLYRKKRREE